MKVHESPNYRKKKYSDQYSLIASGRGTLNRIMSTSFNFRQASPFLLYDLSVLATQLKHLHRATQKRADTRVFFPVKCCYEPAVLRSLAENGIDGFEVMSIYELRHTVSALGFCPKLILTGFGRTHETFAEALRVNATIVIDSVADARQLVATCQRLRVPVAVLFRVFFPNDAEQNMSAYAYPDSKIGLKFASQEFEEVFSSMNGCKYVTIRGLHAHQRLQDVTAEGFLTTLRQIGEVVSQMERRGARELTCIDLGGGIDVLAGPQLFQIVRTVVESFRQMFPGKTLILEPGRSLAAPSGFVGCTVIDIKRRNRTTHIFVDAGSNLLVPTGSQRFFVVDPPESKGGHKITVVDGVLSPANRIVDSHTVKFVPEIGQHLFLGNCGAYVATLEHQWMRPMHSVYMIEGAEDIAIRQTFGEEEAFAAWKLRYKTHVGSPNRTRRV